MGGTRTLDYIVTNSRCHMSPPAFYRNSFSNHKTLQFVVSVEVLQDSEAVRVRKTDDLSFDSSMS